MIEAGHKRALRKLLEHLQNSSADWAVTGSLGMALQGMDLPVHDIDIQTDKPGAYELEQRLANYVVEPVTYTESERMRSHLGKLEIDGVQIEIIGSVQKLLPDGTWEPPVQASAHKIWVDLDGLAIPVLSLEYEYEAYSLMGRVEKAARIRKWLDDRTDAQV